MKYDIIYADPPWSYQDTGYRTSKDQYPVLDFKELMDLPIYKIASRNCVLLLWVTMPKLNIVMPIIKAWGFEYKTVAFTWVKKNKKLFWGMGRWTRSNAELCLLATKGKPKRVSASIHSIIEAPNVGHSIKPDIYDKIVDLLGDIPRIELFARESVDGWDATGLDYDNIDIRDFLIL